MKRTINYKIEQSFQGKTLLDFLKHKDYSARLITRLKQDGTFLLLNGKSVFVNCRLNNGDLLDITIPEDDDNDKILPVKTELDIIYEDEDILVLNKAPKMPVHPSQGNYLNTVANGLAAYFKEKNQPFVFRAVNRLDRDTTGIMVVAKNAYAACALSLQTQRNHLERAYIAISDGVLPPEGTICEPIGRVEGSTIERCIDQNGERAITHFKRIFTDGRYSLAELRLETGRTHQIRVHLRSIGCPIIGDFIYNPDFSLISRQALHSRSIRFVHPVNGRLLTFKAPLFPDMEDVLSKMGYVGESE